MSAPPPGGLLGALWAGARRLLTPRRLAEQERRLAALRRRNAGLRDSIARLEAEGQRAAREVDEAIALQARRTLQRLREVDRDTAANKEAVAAAMERLGRDGQLRVRAESAQRAVEDVEALKAEILSGGGGGGGAGDGKT